MLFSPVTRQGAAHRGRRPVVVVSILVIVPLVVAACVVRTSGVRPAPAPVSHSPTTSSVRTTVDPPATDAVPPSVPTLDQPGWTPVSYGILGIAVDQTTITNADGSQITVARFHAGQVLFALHVGSQDPPSGGANVGTSSGPSVSPAERPLLLAAFNGGFKIASGSGGFEVNNQVLSPLVLGRASFVIDNDGRGHVGVWGDGLPAPGERVLSVRQNLLPLISDGKLSPDIADVGAWGATIAHAATVARSSLGEDAQGNILYAASMSALPVDLGQALITAGAVTAMQLDINPEWVQLALAPSAGAPLVAAVPGQNRPADQYLAGWTRDFVTVVAVG